MVTRRTGSGRYGSGLQLSPQRAEQLPGTLLLDLGDGHAIHPGGAAIGGDLLPRPP